MKPVKWFCCAVAVCLLAAAPFSVSFAADAPPQSTGAPEENTPATEEPPGIDATDTPVEELSGETDSNLPVEAQESAAADTGQMQDVQPSGTSESVGNIPAFPSVQSAPLVPMEGTPCETIEQLRALMEDPSVSHIALTGDIVVKDWTTITPANPVTVEMGDHAMVLDSNLDFWGPHSVSFEGNGNVQPLFQLSGYSGLGFSCESWITARADGATAVLLDSCQGLGDRYGALLHITAEGVDAVAVRAVGVSMWEGNDPLYYACLDISASGPGGVGIAVEESRAVDIRFCRIRAGRASVAAGGPVEVNLSDVSPAVASATTPDWVSDWAVPVTQAVECGIYHYGYWAEPGQTLSLPDNLEMRIVKFTDGVQTDDWQGLMVSLDWEYDAPLPGQPGDYMVYATPTFAAPWAEIKNLEHGRRYAIMLRIADPGRPELAFASKVAWPRDGINLTLTYGLDGAAYRLWRRAGGGDWVSFGENDGAVYYESDDPARAFASSFVVTGLDRALDWQFRLEILDGPMKGKTSVLDVPAGMTFYTTNGGGDRDGGDQGDAGELPPPGNGETQSDPPPGDPTPPPTLPQDPEGPANPPENHTPQNPDIPEATPPAGKPETVPDSAIDQGSPDDVKTSAIAYGTPQSVQAIREGVVPAQPRRASLTQPQLADILTESNENLTFIQNGVKVVIPAALLEGLVLAEGEAFSVDLQMPDERTFSVRFFAGDREILSLGGPFTIYVPYDTDGADGVYCTDGNGEYPALDMEKGKLVFELEYTGVYTIKDGNAALAGTVADAAVPLSGGVHNDTSAPKEPVSAISWIAPCAALCVFAWFLVFRRRRAARHG